MDTVAIIAGELNQCHGSLILDYSEVINDDGLSIILITHFILPWVVLSAFQNHQNSSSRNLKRADSVLF